MKGNFATPCLRGETSGFLQWSHSTKNVRKLVRAAQAAYAQAGECDGDGEIGGGACKKADAPAHKGFVADAELVIVVDEEAHFSAGSPQSNAYFSGGAAGHIAAEGGWLQYITRAVVDAIQSQGAIAKETEAVVRSIAGADEQTIFALCATQAEMGGYFDVEVVQCGGAPQGIEVSARLGGNGQGGVTETHAALSRGGCVPHGGVVKFVLQQQRAQVGTHVWCGSGGGNLQGGGCGRRGEPDNRRGGRRGGFARGRGKHGRGNCYIEAGSGSQS